MEKLKIYTYVDGTNDTLFYDGKNPIYLTNAEVSIELMGTFSITATLKWPVCLDTYWNGLQYVVFRGERYFIRNTPTSSYSNEDVVYTHELEFLSEKDIKLGKTYFIDAVQEDDTRDVYKSNSSDVVFFGDINEFVARLNAAAKYSGLEYTFVVDSGVTTEAQMVSFTDKYILDAMKDSYDTYNVPFYFVGKVCHFGNTNNIVDGVFRYGASDALMQIKKGNDNSDIIRRITGTGSSENIPYYYPNNSPKGNIDVEVGTSNTTLAKSNIEIVNYEKFANNIAFEDKIEYQQGAIIVNEVLYIEYDNRPGAETERVYEGEEVLAYTTKDNYLNQRFRLDFYVTTSGRLLITPQIAWLPVNFSEYVVEDAITSLLLSSYSLVEKESGNEVDLNIRKNAFSAPNLKRNTYYSLYMTFSGEAIGVFTQRFRMSYAKDSKSMWSIVTPIESSDGLVVFKEKETELDTIGISVSGNVSDGDYFYQTFISKIIPASNLMPPIYRESLGTERFYNAINNKYPKGGTEFAIDFNPKTGELVSVEADAYYDFVNEYNEVIPSEGMKDFEDIKPTVEGVTNASGQIIAQFLDVAFDENDNDEQDEDGNYIHPYFFVKLPKFDGEYGFNLFNSASESGEMSFSMTSGACGGCEFIVGVDEETSRNIVQVDDNGDLKRDADGNVLWSGQQSQDRQNDTRTNEVWIALKKEYSTFGVIMPNATNNYRPKAGDTFVILNILLPNGYILSAEDRLYHALLQYMERNNEDKFTFTIDFSSIYFAEHPEMESQLLENSRISVIYDKTEYDFHISSYSYSMDEDSALPTIKVEITDAVKSKTTSLAKRLSSITDEQKKVVRQVQTPVNYAKSDTVGGSALKAKTADKVGSPLHIKSQGREYTYDGSSETTVYVEDFVDTSNFVTIDTEQTVKAKKTFEKEVVFADKVYLPSPEGSGIYDIFVDTSLAIDGEEPVSGGGTVGEMIWEQWDDTTMPLGFHRLSNVSEAGSYIKGHLYFDPEQKAIYLSNGTNVDSLELYTSEVKKISWNQSSQTITVTSKNNSVTNIDLSVYAKQTLLGSLENLTTTKKTDLVTAINEVAANAEVNKIAAAVTVTESTPSGYAKAYTLKQGTQTIGVINIPKDMVVQSGTVETNPAGQPSGTYLVLTLANATSDKVYVNVGKLIDIYVAQQNAAQIQISINSVTREISATIVAGSITAKEIAADTITSDKLSVSIRTSLGLADSALQKDDIATGSEKGTISVDGKDVAVNGLGSMAYEDKSGYVTIGTQQTITGKKTFSNDAVFAKKLYLPSPAGSGIYDIKVDTNLSVNGEQQENPELPEYAKVSEVGDIADLNTTDKSTIVGAINEVQSMASNIFKPQWYGTVEADGTATKLGGSETFICQRTDTGKYRFYKQTGRYSNGAAIVTPLYVSVLTTVTPLMRNALVLYSPNNGYVVHIYDNTGALINYGFSIMIF